jgi:hypothetical protein
MYFQVEQAEKTCRARTSLFPGAWGLNFLQPMLTPIDVEAKDRIYRRLQGMD